LLASDGLQLPVQISLRPLAKKGLDGATIGLVVTDMTEARRSEEMLRALTHRVVQVQETERGHLALELHDNVTQLLCAVLFRSQALADKLSAKDRPAKREAEQLREMLAKTAAEVERISRELRPSVLDQLGLVAALSAASTEFTNRTGVPVKLTCIQLSTPLDASIELALFRILQESLRNVVKHARARHVTVRLSLQENFIHLAITDDGIGFDPKRRQAVGARKPGLGLLGMRERATYVGGTLKIKSARHAGTEILASIPLSPTHGIKLNDHF
jgi:signal transduction histidine kinase